jgi:DNA-binding transcriptional MerR regulator
MRISELSDVTGIPVPTIKYYLREGLVPHGRPTALNQADYGDRHVHRLRLIRALREIGGLGIDQVRKVLQAIADEHLSLHEVLGVAHHALGPPDDHEPVAGDVARAREDVDVFIAALGWRVSRGAPGLRSLADALVALRRLGRDCDPEIFGPYAQAADRIAAHELEGIPRSAGRDDAVESVVVGTVVFEAALAALRRLAQEHYSGRRFRGAPRGSRRRSVARTPTPAPR